MDTQDEEESIATNPLLHFLTPEKISELEERRRKDPNAIRRVYIPGRNGEAPYIWEAHQDHGQTGPRAPLSREWSVHDDPDGIALGLIRDGGRMRSARLASKETTAQKIARMSGASQ